MKKFLLLPLLLLTGCSKGGHVQSYRVDVTMYACYYSPSIWQADRRVAVCRTEEECNNICQNLEKR